MDEFSKNRAVSFLVFYSVTELVIMIFSWIDFPEIGRANRRKIKILAQILDELTAT